MASAKTGYFQPGHIHERNAGGNDADGKPRINTNGHESGKAEERHGLHGFSRNPSVPIGEIRVYLIRVHSRLN
jgi:hypothetical protein